MWPFKKRDTSGDTTIVKGASDPMGHTTIFIPDKKEEPKKELRCHLTVKLTDGTVMKWTNTTWGGVAKGFYAWYFGRPESKVFRMTARDPKLNKPTDAVILRERILSFGTYWGEEK